MSITDDNVPGADRQCEPSPLASVSFDLAGRINPLIDTNLSGTALNVAEALDFIAEASLAHDALGNWLCTLATALRTAAALDQQGARGNG